MHENNNERNVSNTSISFFKKASGRKDVHLEILWYVSNMTFAEGYHEIK